MRDRKLRDDPRITRIGRFLRRYSLDELPQLFNVLRGEMSIVGPRPIATDEAHLYAERFSLYCSVKPGITGAWQVGGRNDVSYQRRVQLDCEYARTKSVGQDLRLLLRTIPVVLRGTGI
jgi:lipopolysaccharide/colanic/teichoic acid biosynthesis glycosyltransferase